ncbi:MAG: tRNA pseudouridine(38-40) synthase TruA [Crocinitomix sp. MedPE-SWsnd]|nr:MAG: tRNA pseudouridine(38-40) synthase TruA [Crocinitomix sp. MedPE-SWsnd]
MANWTHFYLIRIEFLGFRFHGWQPQPGLKSVQGMMDKTFKFIFKHENFKTLGCGRTDAKVSADDFVLELFTFEELDTANLLFELNKNLPADIKANSVKEIGSDFNIIQHSKTKEYHYSFSSEPKTHPYNAPFITNYRDPLNIDLMKEAARLFEGTHNFKRYASNPSQNTEFEREILLSEIVKNDRLNAQFVPEESFVFKVRSKGFLTYQVRLMMGALVNVGDGSWSLDDFKESLSNPEGEQVKNIAPSSGLCLHKVEL